MTSWAWQRRNEGNEVPGDGFNIPKVPDFLNFARATSEVGWARNACTSFFERTNRDLKQADLRTGSGGRPGGHTTNVLVRGSRLEEQKAQQGPSRDSSRRGTVNGPLAKHRKRSSARCTAAWSFSDAASELRLDAGSLEAQVVSATGAGAAPELHIACRTLFRRHGGNKATYLSCGNSVALTSGTYARIACVITLEGGAPGLVVHHYKPIGDSGRHPECGFRWFTLDTTSAAKVGLSEVHRREHVVEIKDSAVRSAGDTTEHYLLNPGAFYYAGRVLGDAGVWSSCPRDLCTGRVRHPAATPTQAADNMQVECPMCGLKFTWL